MVSPIEAARGGHSAPEKLVCSQEFKVQFAGITAARFGLRAVRFIPSTAQSRSACRLAGLAAAGVVVAGKQALVKVARHLLRTSARPNPSLKAESQQPYAWPAQPCLSIIGCAGQASVCCARP